MEGRQLRSIPAGLRAAEPLGTVRGGKGGPSPSVGGIWGARHPQALGLRRGQAGTAAEASAEQQWALVVEGSNCTAQAPPGLRLPRPRELREGTAGGARKDTQVNPGGAGG